MIKITLLNKRRESRRWEGMGLGWGVEKDAEIERCRKIEHLQVKSADSGWVLYVHFRQ
jgi:hypothetical protein